jgi:hypothetical protein
MYVIFKIKKIKPNLLFYIDLWFFYPRFRYPRNFSGTQPPRIMRDNCTFKMYFLHDY